MFKYDYINIYDCRPNRTIKISTNKSQKKTIKKPTMKNQISLYKIYD